ncbi:Protoheme IX farnesyltransferase, mitochondrial [Rhodosporidiobolus nylandii]
MAGYAMCPVDPSTTSAALDAFAASMSALPADASLLDPALASSPITNNLTLSVLLPTTVGTTLCAFSAASFNQLIEAPYDAQMARTRNRPLPRRAVTPLHAASYGVLTGGVGLATLAAINPLAAALGAGTIALYCPLYTIAKRHSVYNTWIGSVVGAIPPLIGWAACTASVDPVSQPGAWALFGLMFFWQFPHFMSLAHTLRSSYASSGYRMLAVLDPPKNALVSLRYSLALIPLCAAFPWLGLTNFWFAPLSLLPNGLMAVAAWRFWKKREERRAKELFWASLIQLPVVLALAMACKKGLWSEDEDVQEEQEQEEKKQQ